MKIHPLADKFPRIEGKEREELLEDIRRNGLQEPIVLIKDEIADGVNRYELCLEAKRKPSFVDYSGETDDKSIREFVWRKNGLRRHLTAGARAMLALEILGGGGRAPGALDSETNRENKAEIAELAKSAGTSKRTISQAKVVSEHGTPAQKKAVINGHVSVKKTAEKIAAKQKPEARHKSGVVKNDPTPFKALSNYIGRAITMADKLEDKQPSEKFHKQLERHLNDCLNTVKEWQQSLR